VDLTEGAEERKPTPCEEGVVEWTLNGSHLCH